MSRWASIDYRALWSRPSWIGHRTNPPTSPGRPLQPTLQLFHAWSSCCAAWITDRTNDVCSTDHNGDGERDNEPQHGSRNPAGNKDWSGVDTSTPFTTLLTILQTRSHEMKANGRRICSLSQVCVDIEIECKMEYPWFTSCDEPSFIYIAASPCLK